MMKKIILMSFTFICITSCTNFFNRNHNHLELVKAKKNVSLLSRIKIDSAYSIASSLNEFGLTAEVSRDSNASASLLSPIHRLVSSFREPEISKPSIESNLLSVKDELKNDSIVMSNQTEPDDKKNNVLAVVSLVLSSLSLFAPLGALIGIILGLIALQQLKKHPERKGKNIAKAGIIVGSVILFIYVVLAIVIIIVCFRPEAMCI